MRSPVVNVNIMIRNRQTWQQYLSLFCIEAKNVSYPKRRKQNIRSTSINLRTFGELLIAGLTFLSLKSILLPQHWNCARPKHCAIAIQMYTVSGIIERLTYIWLIIVHFLIYYFHPCGIMSHNNFETYRIISSFCKLPI